MASVKADSTTGGGTLPRMKIKEGESPTPVVAPVAESDDTAPETSAAVGSVATAEDATLNHLVVLVDGKKASLRFSNHSFSVILLGKNSEGLSVKLSTATEHVLDARMSTVSEATGDKNLVTISTLAKKSKRLVLVKIEAVAQDDQTKTSSWVTRLMEAAYPGVQPRRNLKVFVNPVGGKGNARAIFDGRVQPVLLAARCTLDLTYTTHAGHAQEMAMVLPLAYDAILSVSGDGLTNEIMNGFAKRLDARDAFRRTPIVPIPTGSGNGMSISILGIQEGLDVMAATLNAIKGKPMCLDIASVTNLSTKATIYSCLTQAGGLMAELDLGTEDLRWMGDTRFIIGFVKGVINNSARPLKVTIRGEELNKERALKDLVGEDPLTKSTSSEAPSTPTSTSMPPIRYLEDDDSKEEWITFDKPILYVYGGLVPYVGKDLLEFPLKQPGDEKIHLVVQELAPRPLMLKMIEGAGEGDPFFLYSHNYFEAAAFRVVPTGPTPKNRAFFAMDGERAPYEGFHVEAHKGLMHTLSVHGKFVIPENFGRAGKKFIPRPS